MRAANSAPNEAKVAKFPLSPKGRIARTGSSGFRLDVVVDRIGDCVFELADGYGFPFFPASKQIRNRLGCRDQRDRAQLVVPFLAVCGALNPA